MRKLPYTLAVLVGLVANANAGIPVTVVADVPATANHIETIAKWGTQLTQMKAQLSQLEQTYRSMNGVRGMGALFNDPSSRKYLPSDWGSIYADLEASKSSGLSGSIQAIRKSYSTFDKSKLSAPSGEIGRLYDRSWNNASVSKGFAETAYKESGKRLISLQGLLDKVDNALDTKAVLDLQARIQAEQTMLQNEQIKLNLVQQLAQAERELQQQSLRDSALQSLGPSTIKLNWTKK